MSIEDMTTEQLKARAEDLTRNMNHTKAQIDQAKANLFGKGEYAEPGWWARAQSASRAQGREHQRILQELGRRNKADRLARNTTFEQAFIRVAREHLDPATFSLIWSAAHDERRDADTGVIP